MSNKVKGSGLVPKLRFPEFREAGAWEVDELGTVAVFVSEKIPVEQVALENYVSTENILQDFGGVARASKLPTMGAVTRFRPLDTLVSNIRPYLKKVWVADKEGGASNDVIVIRAKQRLLPQYFSFLLKNDTFIDYVMTGAKGVKMPRGDIGSMKEYPALYPSKPEQQKIADCLASIDERITREAQKLDTLKTHKKGLMQQLFPAEGETLPKLRFPEFRDAGEWEFVPLKELASRRTERNSDGKLVRVLTNSAEHGVVDQRDYFDKDIATQGNLENYLIVDSGDFVYNPRISTFAPVGPISRNRIAKGVMSPLYTVFRFKNSGIDFYAHYFKTSAWHLYMRQVGSTGARHDRMAIANDDFLAMPLPAPSQEEQQKIADCLTSLDDLITAQTQKLAALKTHKKGLMQQLFPFADEVQ